MWLLPPTPYTRAFRIFSLSLLYWKISQCDLGWIFKIHLIGHSIYPFQTAYLYPFQFGEISLIISTLHVLFSFLLELLLFMCWNSGLRFTFYLLGVIFHLFCSTFCEFLEVYHSVFSIEFLKSAMIYLIFKNHCLFYSSFFYYILFFIVAILSLIFGY